MKNKILLILAFVLIGCASESDACRAASNMGLTNCVVIESHYLAPDWYGCHDNDDVAFEVNATNSAKQSVNIVVCCSNPPFASCTIRNQ